MEQATPLKDKTTHYRNNKAIKKAKQTDKDVPIYTNMIEEFIKIGVVGNVDSGKSTLVGVLSKGISDNGRGSARLRVFNYAHEANNGRSSSVAQEIMGFNKDGEQIFPERYVQSKNKYWKDVVKDAHKIISLIDLCGHEKYLKTTMYGLVGTKPDYVMIVVGANLDLSKMTKEHLGIVLALEIPFFVVITKTDMVAEEITKTTTEKLQKLLKHKIVNRTPMVIDNDNNSEVDVAVNAIMTNKICPIFKVSNVSEKGLKTLGSFMFKLQARTNILGFGDKNDSIEFDIHDNFTVNGVGLVVSGILKKGQLKVGKNLYLGPDKADNYTLVQVKSLHFSRVAVTVANPGQLCCMSFRTVGKGEINKTYLRKGMVLLETKSVPKSVRCFEAKVTVLHHASTIKANYEAMLHCGVIRQTVMLEEMDKNLLRARDEAIIRFRFKYCSEYLTEGRTFLLREGTTKIIGQVTKVFHVNKNVG